MQFVIVGAAARSIAKISAAREPVEISGPVGIVEETGAAQRTGTGNAILLVAMLAAYVWPMIVLASFLSAVVRRRG